jgi:hypothetical protein
LLIFAQGACFKKGNMAMGERAPIKGCFFDALPAAQ